MQALRLQIAGALLILLTGLADAEARSQSVRRAFQRAEPCPANMQWQPLAQSLVKDGEERRLCAVIRRARVDSPLDSTLSR